MYNYVWTMLLMTPWIATYNINDIVLI